MRIFLILLTFFSINIAQAQITFGNPNGKIILTEYFDYNCPACRYFVPTLNYLVKNNPDLKVIQKVVPVMSPTSVFIDSAVLAAFMQNKFAQLQWKIMHTSSLELIQPNEVLFVAREIGLNIEQLKQDMRSDIIHKQLLANLREFHKLNAIKIPVIILTAANSNTKKVFVGAYHKVVLQNYINKLRGDYHE
jgi:protein-disulfide isomerase